MSICKRCKTENPKRVKHTHYDAIVCEICGYPLDPTDQRKLAFHNFLLKSLFVLSFVGGISVAFLVRPLIGILVGIGGIIGTILISILFNGKIEDLNLSVAYSDEEVKRAKEAEKLAWAEVERLDAEYHQVVKEGEERLDKLVMEIINTDDRYIKERELIKANDEKLKAYDAELKAYDTHVEISEELVSHLERKVFTVDEVESIPTLRAGDDLTEFKKYIEIARQREDGWGAIQEKKTVLMRDFGRSPEEAEQIARQEYENNNSRT